MSDDALEREIGQAAAERLRAKGWTIEPPPPKPEPTLVTMEESRGRYVQYCVGAPYPLVSRDAEANWSALDDRWRDTFNAADDWLVRTVNRRIIEGLPRYGDSRRVDDYWVPRLNLLRTFCGEETP